jgi:hypothetical protein
VPPALRRRQLTPGTRFVLELDVEQFGHQIIGRIALAPLDVVGEQISVEVTI